MMFSAIGLDISWMLILSREATGVTWEDEHPTSKVITKTDAYIRIVFLLVMLSPQNQDYKSKKEIIPDNN